MNTVQVFAIFALCFIGFVSAAPKPEPEPGFFGKKHEHFLIHVPYKVHTIHHHHVEKIPIYKEVPVIKHVPIIKEVHVPVVKEVHVPVHVEHEHKGWSSDWY